MPAAPVSPALRRARLGVALLFLTNGALFANLLPRYPEIKAGLGLTNAEFGAAVAAFPLGALAAGLAAAGLMRRFGSAPVATAGTVLTGLGLLAAGFAPSWALLAAALAVAGGMDAITDVAQNAHGLRVQRLYGRSILNSFHAVWSAGAVLGGLMGSGAIAVGLAPAPHLALSTLVFAAVAAGALALLRSGPGPATVAVAVDDDGGAVAEPAGSGHAAGADGPHGLTDTAAAHHPSAPGHGPARRGAARHAVLAALVLIAVADAVIEDSGSTWAALYLSGPLGAVPSVAGLGFVALVGAQFVGRLAGDGLVDRFGQRAVARAGGLLVAAGFGAALAFPSVPGTVAGFAAAGLGVATLVPAAMHAADELPGYRPGTALTVLAWLMRLGFLCSPPAIGLLADATSLRTGLWAVPLAGAAVVVLAAVLPGRASGVAARPREEGRAPG